MQNEGMSWQEAYDKETMETMPPGYSEHSTGLAVDLVALDYQILDGGQEQTPENPDEEAPEDPDAENPDNAENPDETPPENPEDTQPGEPEIPEDNWLGEGNLWQNEQQTAQMP